MSTRTAAALTTKLALALLASAALISLTGCYERVVDARGVGADRYQVQEPYQETSAIDRWIFGEDAASKKTPK